MTVICSNLNCPSRSASGFCTKEVLKLEGVGFCRHWFDANGQFRGEMWDYLPYKEPKNEEKIGGIEENQNGDAETDKSETNQEI